MEEKAHKSRTEFDCFETVSVWTLNSRFPDVLLLYEFCLCAIGIGCCITCYPMSFTRPMEPLYI